MPTELQKYGVEIMLNNGFEYVPGVNKHSRLFQKDGETYALRTTNDGYIAGMLLPDDTWRTIKGADFVVVLENGSETLSVHSGPETEKLFDKVRDERRAQGHGIKPGVGMWVDVNALPEMVAEISAEPVTVSPRLSSAPEAATGESLSDVIARCRTEVASAAGVRIDAVRISVEF